MSGEVAVSEVLDDDDGELEAEGTCLWEAKQLRWGFIENGEFIALPRLPFSRAGMEGPPPFDVTLPDGTVRHIVCEDIIPGL